MKKIFFIKFSLYSVLIAAAALAVMGYFSCIDIVQQFNKITIALSLISLVGGSFGSYISEHCAE